MRMLSRKVIYAVGAGCALGVFLIFSIVKLEITRREQVAQRIWLIEEMERFEDFKVRSIIEFQNHGGHSSIEKENQNLTSLHKNRHLWMGIDPVEVLQRWPGLLLDGDYILRNFIDPDDPNALGMKEKPKTIEDMGEADAEDRFYQLVTVNHLKCANKRRMGKYRDGGWDVCVSAPYKPQEGCLVYSFGINYDYSFDDEISQFYGCDVRSYDPSMYQKDYKRSDKISFFQIGLGPKDETNEAGWKLMSLDSIFLENGDTDKIIDYLKIDIEINEWKSLEVALAKNTLKNVKQFGLEIHTHETNHRKTTKSDFLAFYNILLGIEKQGFRRFNHHSNPQGLYTSKRTGRERTCCYEIYYININFLKDDSIKTSIKR